MDEIWNHLISSINEYENSKTDVDKLLEAHIKKIHKSNIQGKNKYRTKTMFLNYIKNPHPKAAQVIFANTLNRRPTLRRLLDVYAPK